MTSEFLAAVRALVDELTREMASGLISRQALIALDRVHRLLDADGAKPETAMPKPEECL